MNTLFQAIIVVLNRVQREALKCEDSMTEGSVTRNSTLLYNVNCKSGRLACYGQAQGNAEAGVVIVETKFAPVQLYGSSGEAQTEAVSG